MAGGTFIVTESQYIVISGTTSDTLGRTMITPDSIRIVVTDSAGTELHDAWYENADAQCALNGDVIAFFDQWEDINGAASTGIFSIMATIASDAQGNVDVFGNQNYVVICVDTAMINAFASAGQALAEVANIDGWNPITDNDSLVIDLGSFSAAAPDVNIASADSNALESVDFEDYFLKESKIDSGAISESKIAEAALDSAKFSADYWNAVAHTGGSASVPDSVAARIDSILASLGYDASVSVHVKIDNLTLSGGGSEAETLIVMSAPDSTLIEGASIVVRTLDQSTVKVDGLQTDQNGRRILELDPDSFFVAVTHNNYTQILDTILVLSGGGTDTLRMARFDPAEPSSPDLCRVFGWVYDLSGTPVEKSIITAEIPPDYHPVKYGVIIITPFSMAVESDSAGYWEMDLFPNQILSKTDSEYLFTIEYPSGIIYKTKTAVPDSSSWQLQ
jgi:hypothetical protein